MAIEISASVGRDGKNHGADLRKVKKLLNHVFPEHPLDVNGDVGRDLLRRIERFQRRFMSAPDGRIDPGGRTLRRLNASAPGAQPDWSGDSQRWSEVMGTL